MTSQTLSLGAKLGSEGEFVRVLSDLLPRRWMGAMNAAASWNDVALLQSFFPGMKKALSKIFGGGDGEANPDGAGKGPSGQGEKNSAALGVRPLRVAKVVRETADAVSLYFEDPQGKPFQFLPGQFLTLTFKVDGEVYRRAYSISSSSLDTGHAVTTTKRVAGGKVSNHINDHVREGDIVEALGPSGTFTVTPNAAAERHLVLLAGGSGITPMMSIARTVLQVEPKSQVTLLYGNRGEADIIFKDAIAKLVEQYGGRFHVEHVLANPSPSFKALAGMMNRDVVTQLVQAAAGRSSLERSYYICGPEGMMAEAKAALQALSVPAGAIHEERFSQPHLRPSERKMKAGGGPIAVTLRTKRGTKEVTVPADRSILEASLDAGVAMPYSCAMGGCGACRVKLVSGDMEMDEPNCLSPEERKEGYVLTCVGHPKTPVVLEVP